jgi:hypothetical protein
MKGPLSIKPKILISKQLYVITHHSSLITHHSSLKKEGFLICFKYGFILKEKIAD